MESQTLMMAYLQDVVQTYRNYKALAERAMAQVRRDEDLHAQLEPESNSIAVIVKHLAGNLRSRFHDFLTTDGEKADRFRDDEFEMPERAPREEILRWWNEAWKITLDSLADMRPEDLGRTIYIRGEAFFVIEALNRNATHTAYHIGQIVYLARHFAVPNWTTVSIPKGKSREVRGDFKIKGITRAQPW